MIIQGKSILGTPSIYNERKVDLLWVVGNDRANFEDRGTEIGVRASTRDWCRHRWAQWGEDACVRRMVQLLAKCLVVVVIIELSAGCNTIREISNDIRRS